MDASNAQAAYLALGSNLGDREALLRRAVELLWASDGLEILASSRVFETAPVGPPPQGPYLNAVLRVCTVRSPRALLDRMLEIESLCGRDRREETRWGPRNLDLDLLLYSDWCIDEAGLELPHPRMHERSFVLEPLCDLAPDEQHPRFRVAFGELALRARSEGAVSLWPCAPLLRDAEAPVEPGTELRPR